jgi:hypothetical protein
LSQLRGRGHSEGEDEQQQYELPAVSHRVNYTEAGV